MLIAIVKIESNRIGVPNLSARSVKGQTEQELDAAIAQYQDFLIGSHQRSLDEVKAKNGGVMPPGISETTLMTRESFPVLWRGDANAVPQQFKVYVWS